MLQPLDVGVFGPLRAKFRSLAADLRYKHQHSVVGKVQTPQLWKIAIDRVCTPRLVKDAFAESGIFLSGPKQLSAKSYALAKFREVYKPYIR